MILWAMLFALGVLSASLCWLTALPILSRRAVRLATARLAQRLPLSLTEIGAERDQLRAVHAVAVRRLEQDGEAAGSRLAAAMADNGRHRARIVDLETRQGALQADLARLGMELQTANAAMQDERAARDAQATALRDAQALAQQRGDLLAATESRLAEEQARADERRATIAGLETRSTGDDLRLQDALAQTVQLKGQLAAAQTALNAVTRERDTERADRLRLAAKKGGGGTQESAEVLRSDLARLRAEFDEAGRAASRATRRAQLQGETINGLADRVLAQDTQLAATQRLLDDALARAAATDARGVRAMAERELGGPSEEADDGSPEREARLRAAVAALGADLVAFSTRRNVEAEKLPAPDGAADDAGATSELERPPRDVAQSG